MIKFIHNLITKMGFSRPAQGKEVHAPLNTQPVDTGGFLPDAPTRGRPTGTPMFIPKKRHPKCTSKKRSRVNAKARQRRYKTTW